MLTLVTGANGFLGRNLVEKLLSAGHQVRAFIQRGSSRRALTGLDVELVEGDVLDSASLAEPFEGVDLVFHLAALVSDWGPWAAFRAVNVDGTREVLRASVRGGARRLVFVSTLVVHPFTGHVEAGEDTPRVNRRYPYCGTKIDAEDVVLGFHATGRMETVIVRPGALILGPWDRLSLPGLAQALRRGFYAHVAGGRPRTCFSYAGNLAYGLVLAGTHPAAAGGTFCLADDGIFSWREIIEGLCRGLSLPIPRMSVPVPAAQVVARLFDLAYRMVRARAAPPITPYRVDLVSRDFHFSNARAKQTLGFRPAVSIEQALDLSVDWYKRTIAKA